MPVFYVLYIFNIYSIVDNLLYMIILNCFYFCENKTKIFFYTQDIFQTIFVYILTLFLLKGLWVILCLLFILLLCTVLKFGENSVRIENEAQGRRKTLDDERDYHEIR